MKFRIIAIAAGFGLALMGQSVLAKDLVTMSPDEVMSLQQRLTDSGCYTGLIDGKAGPAIDAAMTTCPSQDPILRIETGMHTATIGRIAVDAACQLAATGSDDKTVRLWSLPQGKLIRTQRLPIGEGHNGMVYAVAVSPDGRYVAAGGWDAYYWRHQLAGIYFFDSVTGAMRRFGAFEGAILHLAFSPDGARLAVALGGNEQGVRVLEVATGAELMSDRDFSGPSYGVAFGSDGALYAVGYDGYRRRYGPNLKRTGKLTTPGGKQPYTVAVDPAGQRLAIGYNDTTAVEIFDATSLRRVGIADTKDLRRTAYENLDSVAWSSDGQRLVAGGLYNNQFGLSVRFWDADGRRSGPDIAIATNSISSLVPCGDAIAFAATDPAFGLIHADGTVDTIGKSHGADMRGKRKNAFTVSASGTRLRFGLGPGAVDPVLFDLITGILVESPTPPTDLQAPDIRGLRVANWEGNERPTLGGKPLRLEQGEPSRSLAIRSDRTGFVLGAEYRLHSFSASGQERWFSIRSQEHLAPPDGLVVPAPAWGVNLARGGDLVVAAYGDGTVRWHRWSDGQELLALFVNKEDLRWIAWTPTGYYTASPGGEDLMGWHVNRSWEQPADFFPASRFHDRFYRPDVVTLVLETLDEDTAVRLANAASGRSDAKYAPVAIATLLPPVLDLVSAPTRFDTDRVTIQYRVRTPADAPTIGDPRIRVNGEWQPKARAANQVAADGTRDLIIGLPPRDSAVEIYADNRNARSVPLTLSLKWDGAAALVPGGQGLAAERKPRLFVLAVGVSQYQRPDLRLNFADHDARQFVAAMEAQRGNGYAEVTTKLLVNGEATLASIKAGLDWFSSQQAADDVGVLFLAGHGVQTPDRDYFFAPADFDPTHQRETGVDNRAIRSALDKFSTAGNKALFFVDTCYAGGALGLNLAASNGAVLAAILSQPDYGVVVLSASKGDQLSYEGDPQWRGGAFTTALLEGIVDGEADAAHTGEITMLNLAGYVTRRVRTLTQRRQEPMLLMPGGSVVDFALAFH